MAPRVRYSKPSDSGRMKDIAGTGVRSPALPPSPPRSGCSSGLPAAALPLASNSNVRSMAVTSSWKVFASKVDISAGLLATTEASPMAEALPAMARPWALTLFSRSSNAEPWAEPAAARPATASARAEITSLWGWTFILSPVIPCCCAASAGLPRSGPPAALPRRWRRRALYCTRACGRCDVGHGSVSRVAERVSLKSHVRLHPDPRATDPALGHARAVRGAVAGPPVGQRIPGQRAPRPAGGLGHAQRRAGAGRAAALVGGGELAAAAERAVPARRLGAPALQPGVPADLRPAGRAGDGAVAVPGAVPGGRGVRQLHRRAGDRGPGPADHRRQRRGVGDHRRLPGAVPARAAGGGAAAGAVPGVRARAGLAAERHVGGAAGGVRLHRPGLWRGGVGGARRRVRVRRRVRAGLAPGDHAAAAETAG